jgi:outer membrane protein assembly factor BamB
MRNGTRSLSVLVLVAACTSSKSQPQQPPPVPVSGGVLQHHNDAARSGVYVEPAFTLDVVPSMQLDPSFAPTVVGTVYAQPLYLEGGADKPDMLIVATGQNHVYAFDAATGVELWDRTLGLAVPAGKLPCGGSADVGITGTPVIDGATRLIYLDAMTTPDDGTTKKHLVFALDADTGNTAAGWPVDLDATVRAGTLAFDSGLEHERGALALVGRTVLLAFSGLGDCGAYHGWVVGISIDDSTKVVAWTTRSTLGGIWGSGGLSSDGTSVYFATGNTPQPATWQDGEAVFKLPPSLMSSGDARDYFAPANWSDLDHLDADLGGTTPVPIDVPGASPSALVMGLGKDGKVYLLDRADLGGVGSPLAGLTVGEAIINAPVVYTTPSGTYVAFKGAASAAGCPAGGGRTTALKITATSPPTVVVAWCSAPDFGSPALSVTDPSGANAILWMMGTDDRLQAVNAETGAVFYHKTTDPTMPGVPAIQAPMIAKGRIFVGATNQVYVFKPQ